LDLDTSGIHFKRHVVDETKIDINKGFVGFRTDTLEEINDTVSLSITLSGKFFHP